MVVYGDGRPVFIIPEHAMNHGISLFSAVNLDFAAVTFECLSREFDALFDVFCVIRIDGNRWRFNKTLQQRLKLLAVRVCKREQTIPFQCRGHSRSSVELS